MSVAELVKAELLDKGRIRPAEFAPEIGCHREAVQWYMRQMEGLGLVKQSRERGVSGRPLTAYAVLNWDGVESWQPPTGKDPVNHQWDGLMAAFGVRVRNIAGLPTTQHILPWVTKEAMA